MSVNVKKWALAIAIAIVFNLFVNYGIATFYAEPEFSDFCDEQPRPVPLQRAAEEECETVAVSEELRSSCNEKKAYIAYKSDSNGCPTEAYCETCGTEYSEARDRYNANVFVPLLVIAVGALVVGILIKVEAVSIGFLLGGILGLIIATMRFWGQLQDVFRLLILGIALVILIWLGYKKIK